MRFEPGAKSHFSEKNILGLVALYDGLREQRGAHFQCHGFESLRPRLVFFFHAMFNMFLRAC